MTRNFLNTGEMAVFHAPEGGFSYTAYGPCSTAYEAYQRATNGYDADEVTKVTRINPADRHCEDVTEEVADELAYAFASQDPKLSIPAFVDETEIDMFRGGIAREWNSMREQGVA